jgi:acetyltransferase AlgX (SGNH hydrolase-like protein)
MLLSAARAADDATKTFRTECAAQASKAEKANLLAVSGRDGWFFLRSELRHVGVGRFWGEHAAKVSAASKPKYADPLPAIIDFHQMLQKAGIELILLPVPPKALIYPDKVTDKITLTDGKPPRLDASLQQFYESLRKKNITVLDLTPALIAARGKGGQMFCKTDTHWSGRACVLAAELIAKQIKERPWLKNVPRLKLATELKDVTISGGDLVRDAWTSESVAEKLSLRFVGRKANNAGLTPVEPDSKSPIVLLADSHGLVFHDGGDMFARGAGLPDQLAAELGFAVDLCAGRGSGSTSVRITLARRARRDKNYLGGKKLIIWCFAARDLTESFSGWRKVPVVP